MPDEPLAPAVWADIPDALTKAPAVDLKATNGVIPAGQRHSTFVSIAGYFRDKGLAPDVIRAALDGINTAGSVGLPPDEVASIARSMGRYEPTNSVFTDDEPEPLRFTWRTAHEVLETVPEIVPWIIPGYVARGMVTELDGAVKAGKSTLVMEMVAAVLSGGSFIGLEVGRE